VYQDPLSTPAPKVAQLYTEMVGSNALFVGYISLFFFFEKKVFTEFGIEVKAGL